MADLYGTPAAESEEISNISSQRSSAPPHTTASSHVSSAPDDFNFDSRRISSENDLGDSEKEPVAAEAPLNSAPPRNSSKRSRAAEVHNMTEKRRRNKINEKMKALQNLIPNSNKTDKASMLDEAIEYLKQLQLQVQVWYLFALCVSEEHLELAVLDGQRRTWILES